jgi:Ser/Thr protein kinase RdoA (MazF antagonist)
MARAGTTPVERIERLVGERYGRSVRAERLLAERDEIFKLEDADGQLFILKLTSALEDPLRTDFLTQALLHVARTDSTLPTPHLICATNGRAAFRAPWGDAAAPTVRLFNYLPGQPLHTAKRSVAQAAALGGALARLGLALQTCRHPGEDMALDWDVSRAARVTPLLDAIDDPDRRALVVTCMRRFTTDVEPRLRELRRQVVHNDLNPHNVLVDATHPEQVVGIIDFGDIVRTALINDVAIGASYLLPLGEAPLDHPLVFVAAYHSVRPLLSVELDLLYELMTARLAMTVAITQWRALRDPANRVYITKNTGIAWKGLERLAQLDGTQAAELFHDACNVKRRKA